MIEPGEVLVRRTVLVRPVSCLYAGLFGRVIVDASPFRYAWAEQAAKELAWSTFEDEGWSEFEGAESDEPGPPVYLLEIRATSDARYFIADFGLAGNAYQSETGYLMAAGYVG